MKKLYFLDEEEKQRILNIHESATKRQYLPEQNFDFNDPLKIKQTNKQNQIVAQGEGNDPYQYMKWGDKVWFAKKSEGKNPNWIEAKNSDAIEAIRTKIFSLPPTDNKNTAPVKTPIDGSKKNSDKKSMS